MCCVRCRRRPGRLSAGRIEIFGRGGRLFNTQYSGSKTRFVSAEDVFRGCGMDWARGSKNTRKSGITRLKNIGKDFAS